MEKGKRKTAARAEKSEKSFIVDLEFRYFHYKWKLN